MTLGDVLTLEYGKPLPKEKRSAKGRYPVFGANGIKCFTSEPFHTKSSIIVGRKGTAGAVNLVEGGFWPLDVTYFVTFDESQYALKYLYYLLVYLDLPQLATGVKPGINRNNVYSIECRMPPLREQERIVAILDEAFAGIETAIANTEKNLANAQELFEGFLNSFFSQSPEGWDERFLSEICDITSRLVDPREPKYIDLPHVGAGNMTSRTGKLADVRTAREEGLKSGKYFFDRSMVLYSKIRPYLQKVARPGFGGLCSADVYPLSPDANLLCRDFLFYMLLSKDFTDYAIAGSARAGMPKVNRDHLFKYRAALPGLDEQKRILSILDEIASDCRRLESVYQEKLDALSELKQSLLQKAFSSELTADRAKREVAEHAYESDA